MRGPAGCTLVLFTAALCGGPATAADRSEVVAATYAAYSLSPPTTDGLTVCYAFGCKGRIEVGLGAADRAQLAKLMQAGRASAAAERQAIAATSAWFDKRIAPETGTQNHVARANIQYTFNSDRQFDCIDASRNMTSLLLLLDDLKLLRYHVPGVPEARGFFLDGLTVHATAVMTEKASGESWALDAWTRSYGQPAEIMPLAHWKAGRES